MRPEEGTLISRAQALAALLELLTGQPVIICNGFPSREAHKIADRPVAVNGQVVIRPMMFVALSYDHRLIDGKEAVTFLVKVKQAIEDPARLLLAI